jgi:hypothetical protein
MGTYSSGELSPLPMDAEYVHQRDIFLILNEFHTKASETRTRLASRSPKDPRIATEIDGLLNEVDRSLRLKTQAIVRSRLAQSRLVPLHQSWDAPRPVEPPRPPTQATPTQAPARLPVLPITRPATAISIKPPIGRHSVPEISLRRRHIPTTAKHELPFYNRHDPHADPPPLPGNAIRQFGIDSLTQSRLLRPEDASHHLSDLLTVAPFKGDRNFSAANFTQHWIEDRKTDQKAPSSAPAAESSEDSLRPAAKPASSQPRCSFVLVLGLPVQTSADFIQFKRDFSNRWEEIEIVLDLLRRICEEKGLKQTYVDGIVIVEVSKLDPDEVSREKIMRCFVDRSVRTAPRAAKLGFGFIGPDAEDKAATLIQSAWRGYRARWEMRWRKRTAAARLTLLQWAGRVMARRRFKEQIAADVKRREGQYESLQSLPVPKPDQPQVLLQTVTKTSGAQMGRLWALRNPHLTLVLFSRDQLPINQNRVVCLGSQIKVSEKVTVEELLASDGRTLRKIKEMAGAQCIVWHPERACRAGVEIGTRLGALPVVPSPTLTAGLDRRIAQRKILAVSRLPLFECAPEAFDKVKLSKGIVDLTVADLSVRQWTIRSNSGAMGWVSTEDFVVLQGVKNSVEVLTAKDLANEAFRENFRQSVATDLPFIVEVAGSQPNADFLQEVWISGGIVEAGPYAPRTAPMAVFFVSPGGHSKFIGTWERLFLSDHEAFASIHPAWLATDLEQLKQATLLIAAECASKRVIGTSVVSFWESERMRMKDGTLASELALTPDELFIADFERVLPHYLVEYVLNRSFDEVSMSFGPSSYVYVQEQVQLPGRKTLAELKAGLVDAGVKMDNRIRIMPEFTGRDEICLVVTEATPERLVDLVWQILAALADGVFGKDVDPGHPIFSYCHAIEFLKNQTEHKSKIRNVVLTEKKRDPRKKKEKKVFRFSSIATGLTADTT